MADDWKIASKKIANMGTPRKIAKINLLDTRTRFRESFGVTSYPSFILFE